MVDFTTPLGPLTLANPLMAASGCFGYGVEYKDALDLSQLGAVVVKGLFMTEREGHAPPRIVETPGGMLNAIGLQGIGVHRFVKERLPELRALGATTIVNVCGVTLDEYVEVCKVLSDHEGVAGIELNISCPNIKEGGIQFGCSLPGTHDVVSAVVRPRGRGGRRRRDLARQHVPRHGDRRRDAQAEAHQRDGRPQRPGHPPHRRAHDLRVPPGGEDPHRRHGRHRQRRRRARVHARRRQRRPDRHGQLRRSVHLVDGDG
jgi:hypothetical protein